MFFIYKPFEDLGKFRYKNLKGKGTTEMLLLERLIKEETNKRNRPEEFNLELREDRAPLKRNSSAKN